MTAARTTSERADETVSGWMTLSADERSLLPAMGSAPTSIHQLKSGGFLVDVGEAFPVWCADMGAVRQLLLDRELVAAANRPEFGASAGIAAL